MTLLVIGASSDMGTALIEYVAKRYDLIIAHYFHMNDKLQTLKDACGDKMILLQADLTLLDEVNSLANSLSVMEAGPYHVVHFPSRKIILRKFTKTKWEVFEQEYDISVRSLVIILQNLLPKMVNIRYGRIVIILSDAVVGVPPKYSADYITTKYAMLGLMKALSVEYADKGITVNGVSPGFTETKFIEDMAGYFKAEYKSNSPIGRNLIAKDIVPTIAMLLSEETACINGQNIPINCGRN